MHLNIFHDWLELRDLSTVVCRFLGSFKGVLVWCLTVFDVFVSEWTLRELFPYPIEVENTAKNVVKKQPVMNERLRMKYVVYGLKLRAISKQNE